MSLPSRGAWIEIVKDVNINPYNHVAPFTGSVDWNQNYILQFFLRWVAPFTGSVDWNRKTASASFPSCGRSLHGERGLKLQWNAYSESKKGRSLHGERGLKSAFCAPVSINTSVAPFTGSVDWNNRNLIRKTHGEVAPFTGSVDWNRGVSRQNGWCLGSLPSRGAWIEIPNQGVLFFCSRSLPSRGEWIEMK